MPAEPADTSSPLCLLCRIGEAVKNIPAQTLLLDAQLKILH
jgi:hypothetical protein